MNVNPYIKDLRIDYPRNDFQLRMYPIEMEVHKQDPQLHVDMQPVYDSMGLRNPLQAALDKGSEVTWKFYEAVGQAARDGDRMMNISRKEKNPFGNMSVERFFQRNQVVTNVGLMPEVLPDIHFEVYPLEINVDVQPPEIEAQFERPRIRLVPFQSIPSVIDIQI